MRLNSWLIIFGLTGLSLLLGGHTFGINQDAYYLPLIFSGPNDAYRQALNQYVTWFYPVILFFSRFISVSLVWFVFHSVSVFTFILGLVLLSRVLFQSPAPGFLAAIFLMLPKESLGGIMVGANHGYLYQSFFVFPLGLLCLWLFFRGRELLAFSLAGLMANFHSLTAIHLLTWLGLSLIMQKKFRLAFQALGLFLLFSTPILWLNLKQGIFHSSVVSLTGWLAFNQLRSGHHLFPFTWGLTTWFKGLWPLCFIFLVRRRRLLSLLLPLLFIWILALVFIEIFPIKFVIQLQFFRLSMYLVVFGWLCLAAWVLRLPLKFGLPLVGLLLLFTLHWPPKISTYDQNYLAAQNWLKDNTASDSRLYLLPFLPTFRPFSSRSHNLTWPEATVGIVNDQAIIEELKTLADYQINWRDMGFASPVITAKLTQAAQLMSPEAILSLARDADYLVLPSDWTWPKEPVYENSSFKIISLE